MNQDAIDEELLSPPDFKEQLISAGLVATELTDDELFLAESYGTCYRKLSVHDRIALAIAKNVILRYSLVIKPCEMLPEAREFP